MFQNTDRAAVPQVTPPSICPLCGKPSEGGLHQLCIDLENHGDDMRGYGTAYPDDEAEYLDYCRGRRQAEIDADFAADVDRRPPEVRRLDEECGIPF